MSSLPFHLPVLLLAWSLAVLPNAATAQDSLGVSSDLPIREWLDAGEAEEIRWDIDIGDAELRMDQRMEVVIRGRIRGRDLEDTGTGHELSLWAWVTRGDQNDGEGWIAASGPIRHTVEDGLPDNADVEFHIQVLVTPDDYRFWVLMADQTTRQHSLKLERVRVDEVDDEPFPDAFAQVPRIEFPDKDWADDDENVSDGTGDLIMPVVTTRPIDVEVIAGMSTPEQWSSIGASRRHTENITDALTALGQLDIEHGTLSISGLDLIRRQLAFDRPNVDGLNLEALREAFRSTNPGFISVDDLASRIENPGFLRGFVEEAIADTVGIPPDPALPLKVLIVVMGVTQFDDDADVEEIRMDGECDCVAYHIRMRQNLSDLFDQVEGIIDPLDPDRYDVLHPEDLRKAIGRIVEDLERF